MKHWAKVVRREFRLCHKGNNDPVPLDMGVITLHFPVLDSSLNCQIMSLSWVFSYIFLVSQVHMNPSQSTLSIEGDDIDRVDKAMQHISYLNSRQFPTPGIRRLKITSTVKYVLVLTWGIPVQGWGIVDISLGRNKGVLACASITHC